MTPLTAPQSRLTPMKYLTLACVNVGMFLLMWKIKTGLEPYVLLPLIGVVAFSARQAGITGGALSGLLLLLGVWYYFVPPGHSFAIGTTHDALGLLLFAGTAALVAFARPRASGARPVSRPSAGGKSAGTSQNGVGDADATRIPGSSVVSTIGLRNLLRMRRGLKSGWEGLIAPHVVTHVVTALLHVGFFDALKNGPIDVTEFAKTHDLDGELLLALCDELYARKLLHKEGASFSLDSAGRFLLETNLVRGWFELVYGYEGVLSRIEDLLRRKITYGKEVVRDGKYVAEGSGLASADFYFPLVIQMVRQSGYKKILDIGCGDGTFLRHICERMPGLEGVGIDLSPEAVASGNEQLKACAMDERIRLYAGDALEIDRLAPQLRGVDCAATFFVLHELCDQNENPLIHQFLTKFRATLPGVPLHVVETIRPEAEELRQRPGPAVEYFLLHDLSRQKPIGRDAWKDLFHRTGFSSVHENYLDFARSAIFRAS